MGVDNLRKIDTDIKKKHRESNMFKYAKGFIVSVLHLIIINTMFIVSVFSFNVKVLSFALFIWCILFFANKFSIIKGVDLFSNITTLMFIISKFIFITKIIKSCILTSRI